MFVKPSSEVKSEVDEISQTGKQFVLERNVTELAIIELTQVLHRLNREVIKARQRLELLKEQALPNGLPLWKLAPERGLSFTRLRKLIATSGGRLRNLSDGKFAGKSFLVLKMDRGVLPHFMAKF